MAVPWASRFCLPWWHESSGVMKETQRYYKLMVNYTIALYGSCIYLRVIARVQWFICVCMNICTYRTNLWVRDASLRTEARSNSIFYYVSVIGILVHMIFLPPLFPSGVNYKQFQSRGPLRNAYRSKCIKCAHRSSWPSIIWISYQYIIIYRTLTEFQMIDS